VATSRKRVGIRDVAAAAGLSITTVSWALNGKGEVAPGTRERVQRVARELGYQPNEAARALRTGRSRILGIAVAHPESGPWEQTYLPYYRSVVAGAAIEAVEHGHAVAAIPVSQARGLEVQVPCDGLIVIDPVRDDPILAGCRRRGIPVVVDGRPLDEGFGDVPVVESDIATGMRTVLDHLRAAGAERPALLTGAERDAYTIDTERLFHNWCRRNDLPRTVRRVRVGESPVAAAESLLDRGVDAVHALNETYGNALLAAASDRGVEVPDRLRITMMGERDPLAPGNGAGYLSLDPVAIGAACVRVLVAHLNGRRPENVTVPCRFIPPGRTPAG
jgi:DNA-binding LacI/PurR family transcriptional regulator